MPDSSPSAGRANSLRLRSAFAVSSIGDWIYRFAIPTLILRVTGSALATAFAYVLEFIPYAIVGLAAGVVADRGNRRRILVMCDSASAGIAVVIAGIAVLHHLPLAVLYGCAFLLACVRPVYFPAFQGLLVEVIPERNRAGTNASIQAVNSILTMIGPVAGTAIVAATGVTLASLINALSFACSATLIGQIACPRPPPDPQRLDRAAGSPSRQRRDVVAGLLLLWQNKAIRYGSALMAAANLAGAIVEADLIFLIVKAEHLPKIAVGVIFAAQGLGAVIGAAVSGRLASRYPVGRLLTYGLGGSAAVTLLPALVPRWWVIAACWGVDGFVTSIVVVAWFTERQRLVAPEAIGRVVSASRTVAYLTIPLGALLGGWLAGSSDPLREVFGFAAALQAAVCLGMALSPLNRGSTGYAVTSADPVGSPDPQPDHI